MAGPHRNEAADNSGQFVQAGTVHGGVHLHLPPVPPPPRAGQAPPADRKYTNREAEFARIDAVAADVVRQGRSGTVVIGGPAGIGKSAMLAEAADRLAGRFDGGVLHCDLAAVRDRERNADFPAALRRLLSHLQVADSAAETDTAALVARLRDVTAGRRVLLLLDGALSAGELGHFTLGAGPNLVVAACAPGFTGTAELVSRGAESFRLRELRPLDGTRLLREFHAVGRRTEDRSEHDSAERLADLCGGLPSALRMAAGLLESQEDLTIGKLVEAVVARQRSVPGLSGVDAVVDIALSGLGDEERRLLDLLAAHPGRFFPPELGHLALGERAPQVMDRLCEASVLRPVANSGRSIVELVRTRIHSGSAGPAGEPADPAASDGSGRRAVDTAAILRFFTVSHHRADLASLGERHRLADSLDTAELTVAPADYRAPFDSRREAADWQDTHLVHIPELMRLAVDLDRPVAAFLLADYCWPACYGRRRLAIGTSVYGYALQIARLAGHRAAETRFAVYSARLYLELGDGARAEQLVEEAARAADAAGGELDRAVVLEARGLLAGRSSRTDGDDAHDLLLRSREIHRRLRRPRGDALQTYQLGDNARRTGDLQTAEAELLDAERIADRRLAELHAAGDEPSARWLADDWELLRARVRLALARTLLDTDRGGQARAKADAAWQVFTRVAEPVKEVQAARFLADAATRDGDAEQARDLLRHVERLAEHYHLDQVAAETRRELSRSTGGAAGEQ
ncbi:hypothetical protein GCM10027570_28660 [Streptomonospora sediminis]